MRTLILTVFLVVWAIVGAIKYYQFVQANSSLMDDFEHGRQRASWRHYATAIGMFFAGGPLLWLIGLLNLPMLFKARKA